MAAQKYLLTGVTGGLGSKILEDMLHKHHIPATSITATSRSASDKERFESQGVLHKVLDYNQPDTIQEALAGVENFLFVSAAEFDNDKRRIMHQNVVDAAQVAGVLKTWYVSLAFGGFDVNDTVSVQQAHNWTEQMLIDSGLDFVSLRAGVYADAFPLFLNWYPQSETIYLPKINPPVSSGRLALTSRSELGEGIAWLLAEGIEAYPSIRPQGERNIVLLTAADTCSFDDIAATINSARSTKTPIVYLEPAEWVDMAATNDLGGKPRAWFESRLIWFQEMSRGALGTIDTALEILLGRKPLSGVQVVEGLISGNADYTWHQNMPRIGAT